MVEMQRSNGAQRLLAGAVELVLPKGNVLLEFFYLFNLNHTYTIDEKPCFVKLFLKFFLS